MLTSMNTWFVLALPDAMLLRKIICSGVKSLFLLLIKIVEHWYVFVFVFQIFQLLACSINGVILFVPFLLLLYVRSQRWTSWAWCFLIRLWNSFRAVFPRLKSCLHKWGYDPEPWITIINLNPEKAIQSQGMIVSNPFHNLIFWIKTLIKYVGRQIIGLIFLWCSTR